MRSPRLADGRAHIKRGFNLSAFYEVLAATVASRKTTWRMVGLETNVPAATLRRMACGGLPDGQALAVLSAWADLNPADFVVTQEGFTRSSSLAAISTVLGSDPNLDRSAARDLDAMIHLAYARFRRSLE